jgi:hypothetical protein
VSRLAGHVGKVPGEPLSGLRVDQGGLHLSMSDVHAGHVGAFRGRCARLAWLVGRWEPFRLGKRGRRSSRDLALPAVGNIVLDYRGHFSTNRCASLGSMMTDAEWLKVHRGDLQKPKAVMSAQDPGFST